MPHKNLADRRAWWVKHHADMSPEKKKEILEQGKIAKKKYRANLSPEKKKKFADQSREAMRRYHATLQSNPEKKKKHNDRQREAGKRWYQAISPIERRHRIVARRYGLTPEQLTIMYADQNGQCAICQRAGPIFGKDCLRVDHCHRTDTVRRLLCDSCNVGLAKFHDDPNLLRLAAAYLERA